jgi:hypothetical protein
MTPKKRKKNKLAKTKKIAAKKSVLKKKLKKKAAPKKAAPKKKAARKKGRARGKSQRNETTAVESKGLGARSGGQSGDLQGLSDYAGADSESVDELIEEGNSFEAEVVLGVEDVPDADQGAIKTREVPEDDVPEEYLDKDQ